MNKLEDLKEDAISVFTTTFEDIDGFYTAEDIEDYGSEEIALEEYKQNQYDNIITEYCKETGESWDEGNNFLIQVTTDYQIDGGVA
jgi:hypothetical protein